MDAFTDQLGRTLVLPHAPARIVSLVPSQTELLYTLGESDAPGATIASSVGTPAYEVVGITKFCVHPQSWFRQKTRVGGTKDLHLDRIHALRPDLIIANKEENERQQIEELARHYPVWISDVKTLPDALDMIRSIGHITGRQEQGEALATEIDRRFAALPADPTASGSGTRPPVPAGTGPRTAYFIWRDPWMTAGGDTFIHDMLGRCGLTNLFGHMDRYPSVELSSLADDGCDCVLLSSEPYPFRQKHIREIRDFLPDATIRLVDGELFSWYGSRLLHTPNYLQQLAERVR
jgi:ABC-type Fe3+-hydroxamate transport system substrate-binding protein